MTPVGTQQMVGLMVDMMRSAMTTFPASDQSDHAYALAPGTETYTREPNPPPAIGPPLLMYVMAHFPGNTAVSWRRQFFQDIAASAQAIILGSIKRRMWINPAPESCFERLLVTYSTGSSSSTSSTLSPRSQATRVTTSTVMGVPTVMFAARSTNSECLRISFRVAPPRRRVPPLRYWSRSRPTTGCKTLARKELQNERST